MTLKPIQTALSFCMAAAIIANATAFSQEFYVSPTGNDGGPGSREEPFQTLPRARDAVRQVNEKMASDVIVHLRGGEYPVSEVIEFGPQDGGRNGHRVIYKAFEDESPVLTGGVPVTGWEMHDSAKNIYRASVAGDGFRQLYIDEKSGIRARTPNRESLTTFGPWWKATVEEKPVVLIPNESWEACNGVEQLNEVEVVMISHWYHQRIRIGNHSETDSGVKISPVNVRGKMSKKLKFYADSYMFFENALAFVDAAGEWYHDESEGVLYLCVPNGSDPNSMHVTIPRVETLVAIRGSVEQPVENLEFQGLTFQCSNWTSPSKKGLNVTQAVQPVGVSALSWDNPDWPKGIVRAKHARRIALRHNVIRNTGAQGIEFFVDVDDSDIEGNKIYQVAANGIIIDTQTSKNPSADQQSSGVAIWNNHIYQAGQDYTNGDGIFTGNVRGLIVEHNLIHDMPYSGMQIGQQPGGINSVGCTDNMIRNNHIHHCTQLHDDGGGIYTLGGIQTGSVISGNYLHDIAPGPYAGTYPIDVIYLDNYTSKVLVKDNVVNGGKAAERNGSKGNTLLNNSQSNPAIEKNAGIQPGFTPRQF
ncbi:Right handed beta helix region [Neorhodopirellula lusitana]|uniref:Right handed beta helix region n=1 Tax=Neorhodopirellula lusitana TaxID=445327 RepID=A0ABY1QEC5_9BACT|nr:right-handed parallel beta-helix repeat-containing protein [Neorhodopirellula lusitana]SMP65604.1 Right handed beta helix region [Neorhodopirellula lusitana]